MLFKTKKKNHYTHKKYLLNLNPNLLIRKVGLMTITLDNIE